MKNNKTNSDRPGWWIVMKSADWVSIFYAFLRSVFVNWITDLGETLILFQYQINLNIGILIGLNL